MVRWTSFPHAGAYAFDAASLKKHWARLHRGDCEPLPKDAAVLQAWVLFHNGEFQAATEAGLKAGGDGITAANKASCVYANHLESNEETKLELFLEVAARAEAQQAANPENANAWYLQAYALGRHGQTFSVAKALAEGLGSKIRTAAERTLKLAPLHADAHIMLGGLHAWVIDKVGPLIGGMTYGARKDKGLYHFRKALKLNPGSALALTKYANGLLILEGEQTMNEAARLYELAAACKPMDAMERLDVEMAKVELRDLALRPCRPCRL